MGVRGQGLVTQGMDSAIIRTHFAPDSLFCLLQIFLLMPGLKLSTANSSPTDAAGLSSIFEVPINCIHAVDSSLLHINAYYVH